MCQGQSASVGGGRAAAHRELVEQPKHAQLPGSATDVPSALGLALGGVIAAGHGVSAICFLFGITPEWLLAQVVALGLPTPAERPLRKATSRNPWTPAQVQLLVQLWPSNLFATGIARRIGRTPGSVRYKAKWLGLASRDRASFVHAAPEQLLLPLLPPAPPAPVQQPPEPVQHRGGRKKLALRFGQDREYTVEECKETGLRWLAGQHSNGIAQDLNRRPKQVSNLADRLELPPRHSCRNQLTMDYDPSRRLEAFVQQQFTFRQCLAGGNWFWSPKNGPRISKATRNSKAWKDKTGGMDDVAEGGTGSDD